LVHLEGARADMIFQPSSKAYDLRRTRRIRAVRLADAVEESLAANGDPKAAS